MYEFLQPKPETRKEIMSLTGTLLRAWSLLMVLLPVTELSLWEDWWTYDESISGPRYWGHLNPGWSLCNKGHNQSPINIKPKLLLFDPYLAHLEMHGDAISGVLMNQGHALTLRVDLITHWSNGLNFTGGPLSYNYRVSEVRFHFSKSDDDGSEHRVDGRGFSAEIQFMAFNADLYENLTIAMESPRGVACISVLVKIGNQTHPPFERIKKVLKDITYKGDQAPISYLSLGQLIPSTRHFVTYDGSLTHPGCHETVTWVVFNKPIYVSKRQIHALRNLKQDTAENPVVPMAGNIRPVQPLHHRTIRTNIDYSRSADRTPTCSMMKDMSYQVNSNFLHQPYLNP